MDTKEIIKLLKKTPNDITIEELVDGWSIFIPREISSDLDNSDDSDDSNDHYEGEIVDFSNKNIVDGWSYRYRSNDLDYIMESTGWDKQPKYNKQIKFLDLSHNQIGYNNFDYLRRNLSHLFPNLQAIDLSYNMCYTYTHNIDSYIKLLIQFIDETPNLKFVIININDKDLVTYYKDAIYFMPNSIFRKFIIFATDPIKNDNEYLDFLKIMVCKEKLDVAIITYHKFIEFKNNLCIK